MVNIFFTIKATTTLKVPDYSAFNALLRYYIGFAKGLTVFAKKGNNENFSKPSSN